jgi:hypothetical protein
MIDPDDFARDWYGHVTNQCGHIVLGLAIASIAAALGFWWPIPLAAAFLYWLCAEYWLQRAGLLWDGLEDASFVAVGASFPFTIAGSWLQLGLVAGVAVVLAIGAWRRS